VDQDIKEVIAERVVLPPLVVQRKAQAIDMAVADARQIGVMIHIGYLWCSINMSFVIALEGSVQSVGVNEKDDSGEGNKNIESAQPGKEKFHWSVRL